MLAWLRKLSWQWKLTVAFIILFLCFIGIVFSSFGNNWIKGRIDAAYEETPENERRESSLANRYLMLAWYNANIRDAKMGSEMYEEFLGIKGIELKPEFFKSGKMFDGKCSGDGLSGWGPLHDRAPEVYYDYLQLYDPIHSRQMTAARCWEYYYLFYDWMKKNSPSHKPHPQFKRYWEKIRNMAMRFNGNRPNIDMTAKDAPEVKAE